MFGIKKSKISSDAFNKIMQENFDLRKQNLKLKGNLENESFLPCLIHQIGDLIHYQEHDYKSSFPLNANVYSLIGTLLRHFAKPNRAKHTVAQLLQESETLVSLIKGNEQAVLLLEDFNAIMLVDLVSRMQGKTKDDVFYSELKFIEEQYKQKSN